jgi:hypothetical protein
MSNNEIIFPKLKEDGVIYPCGYSTEDFIDLHTETCEKVECKMYKDELKRMSDNFSSMTISQIVPDGRHYNGPVFNLSGIPGSGMLGCMPNFIQNTEPENSLSSIMERNLLPSSIGNLEIPHRTIIEELNNEDGGIFWLVTVITNKPAGKPRILYCEILTESEFVDEFDIYPDHN